MAARLTFQRPTTLLQHRWNQLAARFFRANCMHDFSWHAFGRLPAVCQEVFDKQFVAALDAKRIPCKISDYIELLAPEILFLRRLGALCLEPRASGFRRYDCVFLLDASHPPDILEYWNRSSKLGCFPDHSQAGPLTIS